MRFYIVDVFAQEKYEGNQLLVLKTDRFVSDEEQQAIAREIGFSETAFILSDRKEDGAYEVRIWTPNTGEVPFAGHPVLGTAHVIRQCLEKDEGDTVKLDLKVGIIPVRMEGDSLIMSQNPPVFGDTVEREEIAEIFGISCDEISEEYPVEWVSTGLETVIVPLKSETALSELKMDQERFKAYVQRHPANNCNHLFFVERGDHELAARCLMEDFLEDPATGSANGDLAAYMVKHDFFHESEIRYSVVQGEAMGRRSLLEVHASHIDGHWTIEVGGRCHIVASGEWE